MNTRNRFLKAGIVLPVMTTYFFISSCKKEYPDYPYNEITSFEVKIDEENILKAALEGNEIILYWPPFQTIPDSIAPEISVSDRAKISPASGEKVPFTDGFTYNVTAQDGSTKSFKLKISANIPDPGFYFNNPATNGVYTVRYNDLFPYIKGNYILPDTANTKVFISNSKLGEINMTPFITSLAQIQLVFSVPTSIDTGLYKIKVVSGKVVFEPEERLYVYFHEPNITWPYTTQLKAGGTLTLNTSIGVEASGPTKITRVRLRSQVDDSMHELNVLQVEQGKLTLEIPTTFPAGTYNGIEFTSPAFPNGLLRNIANAGRRFVVSN